jgi:hypothetical protein
MGAGQDFVWEVRVAASGPAAASVYVRQHRFEVGEPVSFDREDGSVSALEHVLGAIGADLVTGFWKRAKRRRLEVDSVEAVVEGRLENPLVFLGVVGETGEPRMESVRVRVWVSTPRPAAEVEAVWREALAASPLATTFRRALDLELSLKTLA